MDCRRSMRLSRWLAESPHDAQLPVHLLAVAQALIIEGFEKDTRTRVFLARNEGFPSQFQAFIDLIKHGQMIKAYALDEFEDFIYREMIAVSLTGCDGVLGDACSGGQFLR